MIIKYRNQSGGLTLVKCRKISVEKNSLSGKDKKFAITAICSENVLVNETVGFFATQEDANTALDKISEFYAENSRGVFDMTKLEEKNEREEPRW